MNTLCNLVRIVFVQTLHSLIDTPSPYRVSSNFWGSVSPGICSLFDNNSEIFLLTRKLRGNGPRTSVIGHSSSLTVEMHCEYFLKVIFISLHMLKEGLSFIPHLPYWETWRVFSNIFYRSKNLRPGKLFVVQIHRNL
jgi:hypothetical protein